MKPMTIEQKVEAELAGVRATKPQGLACHLFPGAEREVGCWLERYTTYHGGPASDWVGFTHHHLMDAGIDFYIANRLICDVTLANDLSVALGKLYDTWKGEKAQKTSAERMRRLIRARLEAEAA